MIAVLLALASSSFWGVSDFLGGVAARGSTVLRATSLAYLGATMVMVIAAALVPGAWSTGMLGAGAVAGVTNVLGLLAFYAAFTSAPMGPMGAIVGATQAIVPVVVAVLWRDETISALAWAGIGIAVLGSVLIGLAEGRVEGGVKLRPFVFAILAGIFFGSTVSALGVAPVNARLLTPTVEMVIGLGLVGGLVLVTRTSRHFRTAAMKIGVTAPDAGTTKRVDRVAIGGGVVLSAANITEILALQSGSLAAVGVVISLYPVTTALLAWVFLHEHLKALHIIGIAAALGGCAMLALS